MAKKEIISENYLEKIPMRHKDIQWTIEEGKVTLQIENTGFFNRVAQKFFRKPKISYVHMDEMGSFIWLLLNGEETIVELGKRVDEHFGEEAHPLYERLAKYIQILESYHFIQFK